MDSDTELQEDEEDILVYVEFEGFVNNNIFRNGELQLDIIGIDTDHPIMQIDGKFYEGTYEDAVGTYMFFDKDDQPVIHDPVFDQAPTLKYFGKTRKILKMQRVFVKQRVEVLGDSEHSKCIPNIDTIKEAGIPPMYQSEALSFWKDIRDKRIDALCAYLKKHKIREEMKSQGIALDSESDEDNPFAIYKDTEEGKSQQNLVNSNTKSSVDVTTSSTSEKASPKEVKEHIHSKPSTSKTSDPIADMDRKVCRPTKLVNRKKVCVKSKTTKKQKKKSKVVEDESIKKNDCNTESIPSMEEQNLNNSTSDTEVNNLLDNIENYIINNFDMKDNVQEHKDINTDINTVETQVKTTDTILDIVENTKDKKHDKLSKREAKLKALLGKLKSDK
ncbi:PREDICTED: uncharacterized protein LOC107065303 [Polistes dominula]|uniref:Uncharacterized protein LOC107065303 n=1 Tax=Polistes dominula TaxID=743375 RepID=A0ABM1I2C9_POLDO|nr:PREDICTED: uncharacterized protein LOC107065303 [Polistes dominula]XP_015174367.1 PREDICTED: uncharacterized protein LOC107065303 [Polistes dominula]XP_015174368.1 PREDICTED: uncharacterized protein LOC107065303 [Polistes dominula]XP_015174369.1 PREDICTED: uncharacterized protein LOC107065303 [Polistes dominula]